MKTISKKIILISVITLCVGLFFAIVGSLLGGIPGFVVTRNGLQAGYNATHITNSLEKTKLDSFNNVSLDVDYADLNILPSDDNSCYLEYVLEGADDSTLYKVSNNTLRVSNRDKNFQFINFGFLGRFWSDDDYVIPDYHVTLYLPKDFKIRDLELYTDSGSMTLKNVKAESAELTLEYGDLKLEDSTLNALLLSMESGELTTKNSASDNATIDVSYGTLEFQNFSCKNVSMNLDSTEVYLDAAKLDTLQYQGEYGELTLLLPEAIDTYRFNASTEYGHIRLPEGAPGGFYSEDEVEQYKTEGKGKKTIDIETESGDITILERGK